ncbi:hypothetical protein D0Z03_000361 [Geotrichum reessii]|nr:hypothetical protein D0Z03_000361 [Galactomyces reessii]
MIVALEELLKKKEVQEDDVALLFVVEEEVGGSGMQFANENLGVDSWKAVIFGEPTEMKLGVGHKGIIMFRYVVEGKAAVAENTEEIIRIVNEIADSTSHLSVKDLHSVDPQLLDYKVEGFDNIILKYATDVPYLKKKAGDPFKRFLYGSGSIHVAHSDHEFVPIKELYDSVDGYKRLVKYSLKN